MADKFNQSTLNNLVVPNSKFIDDLEKYNPKVILLINSAQ